MDEAQFLEELKKDFFEEANSMIESLEKNILIVENDNSNTEAINEIFRSAHTLKGGSATLDFERIVSITHEMENLLDEIRSGNMLLDSKIIDTLLEAIDILKVLIHSSEEGIETSPGIEDEVMASLRKAYLESKKIDRVQRQAAEISQIKIKDKIEDKYETEHETATETEKIAEGIQLNDHEKYLIRMSSEAGYFIYKIFLPILGDVSTDDAKELYTMFKGISVVLQTNLHIEEIEDIDRLEVLIQSGLTEEEIYEEIPQHVMDTITIYKLSSQDIDDITEVVYEHKGLLLSEYDIKKIEREVEDNKRAYKLVSFFDADNPMRSVSGLLFYNMLEGCTTILKSSPSHKELKEPNIFYPRAEFVVSTSLSRKALEKRLYISDVTRKIQFQEFRLDKEQEEPIDIKQHEAEKKEIQRKLLEDDIFESEFISESEEEPSILDSLKRKQLYNVLRVESSRIDEMLNFVGELVIIKASFLQISEEVFGILNYFTSLFNSNRMLLKELYRKLEDLFEYSSGGIDNMFSDSFLQANAYNLALKKEGEEGGDDESSFDYDEEVRDIKTRMNILLRYFDKSISPFRLAYDKLRSSCQTMERVTDDLQEAVMSIRMIPINQIFNRFPRLVRDISRALNKNISLVMEGEDTELDKSVIEDLLDPLIHMVRNAVDHGIESPEERQKRGKPVKGTILLKAEHEGNTIIITVRDDGGGLSMDKLRRKAIDKNIIEPQAELSRRDIIELIFKPGFSTAPVVSSISGRGVGLDVVRQRIENLSGSVDIESKESQWTSFTLKIPLTLAIIQALLIKVADYIYSIPINSIIETIQISYSDIELLENTEIIKIRDSVLSLVHLATLFNHRTKPKKEGQLYVVIVGSRGKKVGLAVDGLLGEQDVVIKPLSNKYTSVPGIAGATILGDGQVSLVIDVVGLFTLTSDQYKSINSIE